MLNRFQDWKNTNSKMLEICVDNLQSVYNAVQGGARRLELCSALSEGGLTPTPGLLKLVKKIHCTDKVSVHAMLRVRQGNFVYSPEEVEIMLEDLEHLKNAGVDGFVFGALTEVNTVDQEICKRIINAAKPLPVTFHRAFDDTVGDPLEILEIIINLGFERLLTSGRQNTALDGVELISELVSESRNRIIVMPGSGINPDNISLIRNCTRAKEFHASAKKSIKSKVTGLFDGGIIADKNSIESMLDILNHN